MPARRLDWDAVVYHGKCMDGSAAAWVASRALPLGPELLLIPRVHGFDGDALPSLPEQLVGKRVLFLDLCPALPVLMAVRAVAAAVLVLDHHVSKFRECGHLDYCYFDVARAGATMAWEYFFPNSAKFPPSVLACIQDHEKWQFGRAHAQSREFTYAWYLLTDPASPDHFQQLDTLALASLKLAQAGEAGAKHIALDFEDSTKRESAAFASFVAQGEMVGKWLAVDPAPETLRVALQDVIVTARAVNVPYIFASTVGATLAATVADIGITWAFDGVRRKFKVSLHSAPDSSVDVGTVAKALGGGGDVHAAEFEVEASLWPLWNSDDVWYV